ncbi:MAG: PAS domain-containing protein [Methanomicrobiales archaeon]
MAGISSTPFRGYHGTEEVPADNYRHAQCTTQCLAPGGYPGYVLAANHAATVWFGLPVHEIIGRDVFALISPNLAVLRRTKVKEAIATKEPLIFLDDRTGQAYENCIYPGMGTDGEVSVVTIYSHDVTTERLSKEALKESDVKYRPVVEHNQDSICVYRDYRFLFVNRQVEEISGFSMMNSWNVSSGTYITERHSMENAIREDNHKINILNSFTRPDRKQKRFISGCERIVLIR